MEKEYIEFLKGKGWTIKNLENNKIKISKNKNTITLDRCEWNIMINIIFDTIGKIKEI